MNELKLFFRISAELIKVIFLFILFTALFYYGLSGMDNVQDYLHRYDEPDSEAVKVTRTIDVGLHKANRNDQGGPRPLSRFFEFIRDGE
ncbi:DUF4227 family protein [Sporolactobacillus terrae]|uniref:DUF4227 domain-containing protein n=1 Tax=Sporolactobacillus terrae TaxID=269673 RepID=A0A410D9A5_9BACL|nr:DUF4227 family protein [Sporolactobacillus terrae]QAA22659.1 DUF4227 domain-containing protein [Sporolactobacillus terrae]QAA25633.1 DUF4227 domain-containing protein [Sporolactobacillus terrae]UAK17443.1 YqzK family protein [Sporolactobacillus terrae]BBN98989.1 hypothetical protein St703_16940 [Sporolactobacillus terrae]